jgi:hypothetical protein
MGSRTSRGLTLTEAATRSSTSSATISPCNPNTNTSVGHTTKVRAGTRRDLHSATALSVHLLQLPYCSWTLASYMACADVSDANKQHFPCNQQTLPTCGPPKPLNAVLLAMFVRHMCPRTRCAGNLYTPSACISARSITALLRSQLLPANRNKATL